MRTKIIVLLVLLAMTLVGVAGAVRAQPVEFDEALNDLWVVGACGKQPLGKFDTAAIKTHCKELDRIFGDYEKRWASKARPFFKELVPSGLPGQVVYPFGGADLLTALVVYPNLDEITSISLEAGGDPRSFQRTGTAELTKHLALHRKFMDRLVTYNHSRTLDLALLKGTPLPSQLIFALVGLKVHGYEPVGLRAIRLNEDGTVHYFSKSDLEEADKKYSDLKGSTRNRRLNDYFSSYELRFRKAGVEGAKVQTYRHFQMNLANDELAKDSRILKHLDKKGSFATMTKGASYLLWWGNFKTFRDFLMQRAAWMVSDSTGFSAVHLDKNVWEQLVYGKFLGSFIKSTGEGQKALFKLYEEQPARPLPFDYFGYPDKRKNGHLVVTRRR